MSTDDQDPVYYPKISPSGRVLDQILQSLPQNMRTRSNLAEIAKTSWPVQLQVSEIQSTLAPASFNRETEQGLTKLSHAAS